MEDPHYSVSERFIKEHSYKEYKLSDTEQSNLKEIETEIDTGKITSENKNDILEYLEHLYEKLVNIKKKEYEYEGEDNFNINRALSKVKGLIIKIEGI